MVARSRNIKPGFFINDSLAEVDPMGRLLFAGLWCIADRAGRLEDRPKRIRAEVLPYDDCDVDELLNQLAVRGFILRYEVAGEHYIQIANFSKHQNPHKNEAPSIIPAPEQSGVFPTTPGPAPEHSGTSTVLAPEEHSTNRADSLNLIPDSLNTYSASPDGDTASVDEADPTDCPDEEPPAQASRPPAEVVPLSDQTYSRLFEHWNSVRAIVHKSLTKDMIKAMKTALKTGPAGQICLAMDRYAAALHDEGYFYEHRWTLEKFLKQKNGYREWLDEGQQWINYQSRSRTARAPDPRRTAEATPYDNLW